MELERLNAQQVEKFGEFIYDRCGIRIDSKKVTLLSNRVRRRLKAGGFQGFDEYFRFLTSPQGSSELGDFLDAITTNETFFFRTPKQFAWLSDEWLGEIVRQQRAGDRDSSIKIWSAGCSSGAEPYSIAICLAENMYRLKGWKLEVLGTDISQAVLELARSGSFKPKAIEEVTESQRRRFFRHNASSDDWQLQKQIRDLVHFDRHNLIDPMREGPFDCIFIRNVLIYFDEDSKRTVVQHLLNALKDGGHLVVGPSEGIFELLRPLHRVTPLIYQKLDKASSVSASNLGATRS